jgi:hypothetical protein
VLKRFLEGYALAHGTTTAKLVREIVAEWVYEKVDHTPSRRVDHTLRKLDFLSKRLQLKVATLPAREADSRSVVVRPAGHVRIPGHEAVVEQEEKKERRKRVDWVKEREDMYQLVVAMLKEAEKLSENEAVAKKAKARMDAMAVAGTLARVGETILSGYERAIIQPKLEELEKLIEDLKQQTKQTDKERKENSTGNT